MALLIGLLLVLFSVGVVIYPFLKVRLPRGIAGSPPLEEPALKRQAVYSDIQTLELEHELGKLDEEDYRLRLQSYRLAAPHSLWCFRV